MKGLAKGIEGSRGLVEKAVRGVSEDMVISPRLVSEKSKYRKSRRTGFRGSLEG